MSEILKDDLLTADEQLLMKAQEQIADDIHLGDSATFEFFLEDRRLLEGHPRAFDWAIVRALERGRLDIIEKLAQAGFDFSQVRGRMFEDIHRIIESVPIGFEVDLHKLMRLPHT